MSGIPLIIAFVIAIALMIYAISKLKIHPFLSIMTISLIFALVAGIPLTEIPDVIGTGFSNTFKSIGIVIILGTHWYITRKNWSCTKNGRRSSPCGRKEKA